MLKQWRGVLCACLVGLGTLGTPAWANAHPSNDWIIFLLLWYLFGGGQAGTGFPAGPGGCCCMPGGQVPGGPAPAPAVPNGNGNGNGALLRNGPAAMRNLPNAAMPMLQQPAARGGNQQQMLPNLLRAPQNPALHGHGQNGGKPAIGGMPLMGAKPAIGGKPIGGGKPAIGGKPAVGGKPAFGGKPLGGGKPAKGR